MSSDDTTGTGTGNLAERLKQLEGLTAGRPRRVTEPETTPEHTAPAFLVPVPRRARIFLRHGEGHGEFADLTLTAPVARARLHLT